MTIFLFIILEVYAKRSMIDMQIEINKYCNNTKLKYDIWIVMPGPTFVWTSPFIIFQLQDRNPPTLTPQKEGYKNSPYK